MATTQQCDPPANRSSKNKRQRTKLFKLRNLALATVLLLVFTNLVYFHSTISKSIVKNDRVLSMQAAMTTTASEHDKKGFAIPIPLEELTMDDPDLHCPEPLVAVHDRIVDHSSSLPPRKIPRLIHITMETRCLPPDQADTVFRWQNALPHHSVYFHDDDARQRLIRNDPWPEFPMLVKLFDACVEVGGAVTADIWRNLVLYRYGGLYTDIDNWPLEAFTEDDPIEAEDSAFFFTDPANRPSQWFMSMEPNHPIAYFNMNEILNRIWAMEDISNMQPVKITGPQATKIGYLTFLEGNGETRKLSQGVHFSSAKYGFKRVQKRERQGGMYIGKSYNETHLHRVPYVDENGNTIIITRSERIKRQSGLRHWLEVVKKRKRDKSGPKGSCWDRLFTLDTMHLNHDVVASVKVDNADFVEVKEENNEEAEHFVVEDDDPADEEEDANTDELPFGFEDANRDELPFDFPSFQKQWRNLSQNAKSNPYRQRFIIKQKPHTTIPTPIFISSLQKTGTVSATQYFKCGGYEASHHVCRHKPACQNRKTALSMKHNIDHGIPPLQLHPYTVFADTGYASEDLCFNPTFDLQTLYEGHPNMTILHMVRNTTRWYDSINSYENGAILNKWRNCKNDPMGVFPLSNGTQSDFEELYDAHTAYIRHFVKNHPSLTYIEAQLEDPELPYKLEVAFGIPSDCWKVFNTHDQVERRNRRKQQQA